MGSCFYQSESVLKNTKYDINMSKSLLFSVTYSEEVSLLFWYFRHWKSNESVSFLLFSNKLTVKKKKVK